MPLVVGNVMLTVSTGVSAGATEQPMLTAPPTVRGLPSGIRRRREMGTVGVSVDAG